MAKYLDDIRQGDTIKIQLNYGSTVDLTGYSFSFTLKENYNDLDADAILQATTTAGDYVEDDPDNGIVYIVVDAEDSFLIPPKTYYYTVKETNLLNEIKTLVPPPDDYKDKILVAPEV